MPSIKSFAGNLKDFDNRFPETRVRRDLEEGVTIAILGSESGCNARREENRRFIRTGHPMLELEG